MWQTDVFLAFVPRYPTEDCETRFKAILLPTSPSRLLNSVCELVSHLGEGRGEYPKWNKLKPRFVRMLDCITLARAGCGRAMRCRPVGQIRKKIRLNIYHYVETIEVFFFCLFVFMFVCCCFFPPRAHPSPHWSFWDFSQRLRFKFPNRVSLVAVLA